MASKAKGDPSPRRIIIRDRRYLNHPGSGLKGDWLGFMVKVELIKTSEQDGYLIKGKSRLVWAAEFVSP